MTIIHTASPQTGDVRRSVNVPVREPRAGNDRPVRARRPDSVRPAGEPPRYRGTGVAMSMAPHDMRRPVKLATTVGLALGAGIITLWLGLMAHVGQMTNGETGNSARVPDRLAVVRVEPGESLRDVAARVAPDAPARQVADRIRELNDLGSSNLVAGDTLIAPVG